MMTCMQDGQVTDMPVAACAVHDVCDPDQRSACTCRFDMEKASEASGWQQELAGGKDHIPETEALGISSFVYK